MSDALSSVSTVLAKGKTLREVLSGLVRPKKQEKPTKVAVAAKLTDTDKEAMALLLQVYGGVCPQTRTALTEAELTELLTERRIIDQVARVVDNRKEGIRTTVLNHFDVTAEKDGTVDETTPVDKDGHYLNSGTHQVPAPGTNHVWSWEVAEPNPTINVDRLYDLCHNVQASGLTHKDWLAMTYQPEVSRAFDEKKALAHIQAHPQLLEHLEAAMDVPPPKGALWTRKEKG